MKCIIFVDLKTFWKWQKNCTYLIVLSSPPLKIMSLLYHKQRFEFPVRPSMMRGSTSKRTHLNWKIQLYISNNHHKTDNIQKIYNWLKIFCMNQNKICHKLDVMRFAIPQIAQFLSIGTFVGIFMWYLIWDRF